MDLRSNIDTHGRLLIPAIIRKKLDYNTDDTLVLRVVNGELHVLKLTQLVTEAQKIMSQYCGPEESLLDDFLRMRHEEFINEEQKYKDKP